MGVSATRVNRLRFTGMEEIAFNRASLLSLWRRRLGKRRCRCYDAAAPHTPRHRATAAAGTAASLPCRGHPCQQLRSRRVRPPEGSRETRALGRGRGARAGVRLRRAARRPNKSPSSLTNEPCSTGLCSTLPRNHTRDIQDLEISGFTVKNGRVIAANDIPGWLIRMGRKGDALPRTRGRLLV
jgi:hypothetical protein